MHIKWMNLILFIVYIHMWTRKMIIDDTFMIGSFIKTLSYSNSIIKLTHTSWWWLCELQSKPVVVAHYLDTHPLILADGGRFHSHTYKYTYTYTNSPIHTIMTHSYTIEGCLYSLDFSKLYVMTVLLFQKVFVTERK